MKLPIGAAIVRGVEARGTTGLVDDSISDGTEKGSITSVLKVFVRRSFWVASVVS